MVTNKLAAAWTPRARVAVALAGEAGHDWARWALGLTAPPQCSVCFGVGHPALYDGTSNDRLRGCLKPLDCAVSQPTPVPDPLDTAAYLADCERRGVAPGPLPSVEWYSSDEPLAWQVCPCGNIRIECGAITAQWYDDADDLDEDRGWLIRGSDVEGAPSLARLARMIAAVDSARAAVAALETTT